MDELIKRAAPGLALVGVALSTVWLFDPALRPGVAPTAAAAAGDSSAADSGSDPTTAGADCSSPQSATGEAVMTEWGPVQVQVEFASDGSVCSVAAVAYPANDPKSARINARAIPYLDQQASQVGTAFDSVSGATYTSEAYRQSLQSALDQR